MARKIFVSYKHSDDSVKSLDYYRGTVRSYVDRLVELFDGDEIYKGEGNEDLIYRVNQVDTVATIKIEL